MNVIDNTALAQNIKDGISQAQASGLVLEDHETALLTQLIHGAIFQASTDVSAFLQPVLASVATLQATLDKAVAESAAWRAIIERFNLSPPGALK
jgi:hypothetical protein